MKKIIILLSFTCACLLFSQNVFAQTEEESKQYIKDFIETIFKDVKPNDPIPTPIGEDYGDGTGNVPPINYDAIGLPAPDDNKVSRLKEQIENNQQALWAVKSLLAAEKDVSGKGYNVIPYLTTAWIWFENGQARWPDPYSINCNDNRPGFLSEVQAYCGSRNFQIGGYQAAAKEQIYISTYNRVHAGDDARTIMQQVVDNSTNAIATKWNYKHSSQQKGLVAQYLPGGKVPTTVSINNISPNRQMFSATNPEGQFYTLLLGKTPRMVIALNSSAVSEGDLVRGLKRCNGCSKPQSAMQVNNCTYGYICNTEEVLLASMTEALRQIDGGGIIPPEGGPIDQPPVNSGDVLGWAQQISNNLIHGSACGVYGWNGAYIPFYCRMTSTVSNGSYSAAYREGRDLGVGRTGLYWCTRLVVDAANLAGRKGLTTAHEGVVNMIEYWKVNKAAGYNYFGYHNGSVAQKQSYIQNLKPGCGFFQVSKVGVHTGREHASVVKIVDVKSNGNGTITTLDSNSSQKEHKYTVAGWQITDSFYPYVSFGCFN